MARIPYQRSSEAAARITKKVTQKFRHNRLALFDEMNVVQTRKHVKKLYKSVYSIIQKEYASIINPLYEEIYDEAVALGFDGDPRDLDEAWIEEFFDEYSPVTKYVFKNELGRKESRLFESLVACSTEVAQSYKTAERLLINQIKQSSIELEDDILIMAYKDAGVEKVRWIAEKDYKTCSICSAMDGEVFGIDEVPPKQHINCRCYLVPAS